MTMRWKGWTVAKMVGRMLWNLNPSATHAGVRAPIIGPHVKYVVYSHEMNNKFEKKKLKKYVSVYLSLT